MSGLFPGFETFSRVRSNRLYYGDNLTIMQNMPPGCIDLIYLDPPFNSQRTYNLIYKQLTGLPVPEQEEAFCDAWDLDPEKEEMARKMPIVLREYGADEGLVVFWDAWIKALRNTQPRLLAYLVYMTYRLFEMRRLLKLSGSIFLHCDPTAGHYIKVMMDGIFGHQNFRNEIIWRRTGSHNSAKRFGPIHDVIYYYTKSDQYTWNRMKRPYMRGHVEKAFIREGNRYRTNYSGNVLSGSGRRGGDSGKPWRGFDPDSKGRHWAIPRKILEELDEDISHLSQPERLEYLYNKGFITIKDGDEWPRYQHFIGDNDGQYLSDIWAYQPYTNGTVFGTEDGVDDDVRWMGTKAGERIGYPTQKPIGLLNRIVLSASREGEVVLDPFCGCGTTIYAAHLAKRKWIGCDIAIHSIRMVRARLTKNYGLEEGMNYEVTGIPRSVDAARELFSRDPGQFQKWAVEISGGFSSVKHSGDRGIDGRIYYETAGGYRSMVISVKGGKLTPAFVRELRGTMERERDVDMAGFISLEQPTKGMLQEAADAGRFEYLGKAYDRLQLRTIDDLLAGRGFQTPSMVQTLDWQRQAELAL